MKTIKYLMWITLLTGVSSCTVYNEVAYVDPIYSSHPDVVRKPAPVVEEPVYYDDIQDDTYSESYVDENGTTVNNYYGTTYNSYAGRINRFRRVNPGFGYFSPVYNPGWNVGFGFNSWGGSSFYMGYNSGFYDPFWDPFWSPFAYDPWFCPSPWGWNAWRPYSYWRPYYAPVYANGDYYRGATIRRNPARYGTIPRSRSGFGSTEGRRSNAPVGTYKSGSTNERPTYNNRRSGSGAERGTTRKNEPNKPRNPGVQRPTARPTSPSGNRRPTTRPTSPGVQRPSARPSSPGSTRPSRPTPPPRGRSYQPRSEEILNGNNRPSNTVKGNSSRTPAVQKPRTQQTTRSSYQRSRPASSRSYSKPRSTNRSNNYSRPSRSSRPSYSRPSGGSRSASPSRSTRSSRPSRPR